MVFFSLEMITLLFLVINRIFDKKSNLDRGYMSDNGDSQ